ESITIGAAAAPRAHAGPRGPTRAHAIIDASRNPAGRRETEGSAPRPTGAPIVACDRASCHRASMTQARLQLGVSEFRRLREDELVYVDKSLLVRDVIADAATVLLLPRPRRFGKTTNLSMLRTFFSRSPEP